jgi:Proteins containing SET domain
LRKSIAKATGPSFGPVVVAHVRNGMGLVAAKNFRRDETILKIPGRVVDAGILWDRGGSFADNCIRFGPETYLDPRDGPGRFLNHSCEPNAAVRKTNNQLFLVAAQSIDAGDEVVIDYSTTLGDDDIWTMRCHCGRKSCRHRIKRFGSLPAELQRRYVERGLVPKYIIETLR